MKRGRKAQFYLMAAVIIMMIIFGIFAVGNYANIQKKEVVVYDLKKELNVETGRVVDFAIYNKNDTSAMIDNWTQTYVSGMESKEVENWVFVYGDSKNISVVNFVRQGGGNIGVELGSGGTAYIRTSDTSYAQKTQVAGELEGKKIQVIVGQNSYEFVVKKNQNFAFLLKKGEYTTLNEEPASPE
jgi:hypothetical protein